MYEPINFSRFSLNEEKMKCPNCGHSLLHPYKNLKDRVVFNTLYDFNEDQFSCNSCNKVIQDAELTRELKLLFRLD